MVHKTDKVLTLRLVNEGEEPTASIEKCQAERDRVASSFREDGV